MQSKLFGLEEKLIFLNCQHHLVSQLCLVRNLQLKNQLNK